MSRPAAPERRILIVHSVYRTRGGEEHLVELEERALLEAGITVRVLTRNGDGALRDLKGKARAAADIFTGGEPREELLQALAAFDPDAVHFHNLMPHWGYATLEAALSWALRKGRKVATTVHNQRWVCANGLFWRGGGHCELCFERQNPLWGALYNCRGSAAESALYAGALSWAWAKAVYNHPSHLLMALNTRTAERLHRSFPCSRVEVLPNPVVIPAASALPANALKPWPGRRLAVIGRLSPEKGTARLLERLRWGKASEAAGADDPVADPTTQFILAGDGPLRDEVTEDSRQNQRLLFLGPLTEDQVPALMKACDGLFFGSIVEEQSPTVLRQAVALGIPVYGWQGRMKGAELAAWGPALTLPEWSGRLLKLLT